MQYWSRIQFHDAPTDEDTEPEMHKAVERNDIDSLKSLLELGADPNVRGFRGATPLHVAAREMRLECVKILLQYGADPNAKSKLGSTPISWGMATKKLDRFTGKIEARTTTIDIAVLQALVDAGAELVKEGAGCLLHTAADYSVAVAKFFIDCGIDPSARDTMDKTPLGWAADHGSPEMVKFLLEEGSPIYALSHTLETSLCRAVRRAADWRSVELLLREHHNQQAVSRNTARSFSKPKGAKNSFKSPDLSANAPSRPLVYKINSSQNKDLSVSALASNDIPDGSQSFQSLEETETSLSETETTAVSSSASNEIPNESCVFQTLDKTEMSVLGAETTAQNPSDRLNDHQQSSFLLSDFSEGPRFDELIRLERNYHQTDQDIRVCLRKGLGPNPTTHEIIKRMFDTEKVQKSSENKSVAFMKRSTPACVVKWKNCAMNTLKRRVIPPITKAAPFISGVLFTWVSYYLDFGLDVYLAVQRLSENPGIVALVLTWLFAFLPSIFLNIRLCYERLSFFREFEKDLVYKEFGFFKHFLILYENRIAAIFVCIFQGWPALIYLQSYHINQLPIHIIPSNILHSHKVRVNRMVRLVRQWEALLEASPMLFLQLWITLSNQQALTATVAVKLAMSIFSISFNLLKEEMLAKSVEIPVLGKIFLLLSFYLRSFARTTSIVIFTYSLTFWIIPLIISHIVIVIGLQAYEFKRQNTGKFQVRKTEAISSIFNYIPNKNYEVSVPVYSRLIFLVLSFVEDLLMLILSYLFLSHPPYSDDFILYCLGAYFSSIVTSCLFLVIYYKVYHPWSWNVNLFRFLRSQ